MTGRDVRRLQHLAFCELGAMDGAREAAERWLAGKFEISPADERRAPQVCRFLRRLRERGESCETRSPTCTTTWMAQIETLACEDLSGEELEREIARAKALTSTAGTVIENGRLVLDAQKQAHEQGLLDSRDQQWKALLPGERNGS